MDGIELIKESVQTVDVFDDIHAQEPIGTGVVLSAPLPKGGSIALQDDVGAITQLLLDGMDGFNCLWVVVNIDNCAETTLFQKAGEEAMTTPIIHHGETFWCPL